MSLELQQQVNQFYDGVSAIIAEHAEDLKKQYPILSQVDARISAAVLTLLSVCWSPMATVSGLFVGFLGMGRYPDLLKEVKQINETASTELKVITAAAGVLLLYAYFAFLLPFGIGASAGVFLSSTNEKMILEKSLAR